MREADRSALPAQRLLARFARLARRAVAATSTNFALKAAQWASTDPAGVRNSGAFMERSAEDMQSLLVLRKLTRAIAEVARGQLVDYLTTLTPLMRAETVLGNHVHGGRRDSSRRPDQVLKEFQAQYDVLAPTKPLNLQRERTPPLEFAGSGLEISPVEYIHEVRSGPRPRRSPCGARSCGR
jgi:hypothetical protein